MRNAARAPRAVQAPELTIRLKQHPDGSASLTCVRRDGSSTWQRQRAGYGLVFPPHDLTHYAVETTLGVRHGFYGLIADGWDITDFASPWPRGPIPFEAGEVELIVGLFDSERLNMARWSEAEFRDHADRFIAARRATHGATPGLTRQLSGADLERVREARAALLGRWGALGPGEALELPFDRGALA
jgi:hypothetical protein